MARRIKPTTILSEDEVLALSSVVRMQLGPEIAGRMDALGFDMDEHVRLGTLAAGAGDRGARKRPCGRCRSKSAGSDLRGRALQFRTGRLT